jgi:hypothetical protein
MPVPGTAQPQDAPEISTPELNVFGSPLLSPLPPNEAAALPPLDVEHASAPARLITTSGS